MHQVQALLLAPHLVQRRALQIHQDLIAVSRDGFLPEETPKSVDGRKKLEERGFFRKKLEETGRNWKKLGSGSELLGPAAVYSYYIVIYFYICGIFEVVWCISAHFILVS